jgi:pimeloyl-ACP methyl ester carboxylesterase
VTTRDKHGRQRNVFYFLVIAILIGRFAASESSLRAHEHQVKGRDRLDLSKLEGTVLHPPNHEDVQLLAVLGRNRMNQALATGKYTPEQARLATTTMRAYQAKDFTSAYRHVIRFLVLMDGGELNEGMEMASSYQFSLDRKIVPPGGPLRVLLQPIFTTGHPLSGPYTVRLNLKSAKGEILKRLEPVVIREIADREMSVPTQGLTTGTYLVHYKLISAQGAALIDCTRDFIVNADVPRRLADLKKQLAEIRRSNVADRGIQEQTAVETIEYVIDLFERTLNEFVAPLDKRATPMTVKLRGQVLTRYSSDPFDVDKDLGLAQDLCAELLAGKNPLATRKGDMRLAYRSPVDKSLQPFRVFVPSNYNPAQPCPLIVALHGATGDENTYMDRYTEPGTGKSLFKKLGEQRGYILATPNGRGPFGLYVDNSARDVLDVVERMHRLYQPAQIFLTGHSMGGSGTWMLGFKHPEKFAALAPVAGRPQDLKTISLKNAPDMPVWFASALKDTLVTPDSTRQLAKIAKSELGTFKYVEFPEEDHFTIGIKSMPGVFDFFDGRRMAK